MRTTRSRAALAAAVLAAFWMFRTLSRRDERPGLAPPPPSVPIAAAPRPAARRTPRVKIVPKKAAKIRGAELREKGEALGGGSPDAG